MDILKRTAGILFIVIIFSQTAVADSKNSVTYKSEKGSVLVINWHGGTASGLLDGKFTANTGKCVEDKTKAMPISGYYTDNLVTFSISFPKCKQVIAMTGYVSKNRDSLEVMRLKTSAKNNDTKFSSGIFKKVKK